jgi:hypothetical protein
MDRQHQSAGNTTGGTQSSIHTTNPAANRP